jgi:hypothetical protein
MTDLNPTLMKQVFDIAQRQWEPNIEHHREADDLWTGLEVPKRRVVRHPEKLTKRHDGLKQSCSDSTVLSSVGQFTLLDEVHRGRSFHVS